MAMSKVRNIVNIDLKEAKKNHRMDIYRENFEMVENSAFIIDIQFKTIDYIPESVSNYEVQAYMRNNKCMIFPSINKCLCSLNQQKPNVVLADYNRAYVTEKTDQLFLILQGLSSVYGKTFYLEYDVVKHCLKEKTQSKNGEKDISIKHIVKFQCIAVNENNKRESKKTTTTTRKIIKPRTKMKMLQSLCGHPVCLTNDRNLVLPISEVNNNIDPRLLCHACSPLGEIMAVCAEPNPIIVSSTHRPQSSHQSYTRDYTAHNAILSNNNPTPIGRLVQAPAWVQFLLPFTVHKNRTETGSNLLIIPETVPILQEMHHMLPLMSFVTSIPNRWQGQDYFIKAQIRSSEKISAREQFSGPSTNGRETGKTSISAFTASDHIRSPQYQAYTVRLLTFTKWPPSMTQSPEEVAQAGFYYTGLQDVVRCFACDGGLKNWDPEDYPWVEHARWFPQCPFVQKVKGTEFVDLERRMTVSFDEEEDNVKQPPYWEMSKLVTKSDTFQREKDDLKSIVTCIKCKVRGRNILFLQCTHCCLCHICAEKCSLCPICYKIIKHKIKIKLN